MTPTKAQIEAAHQAAMKKCREEGRIGPTATAITAALTAAAEVGPQYAFNQPKTGTPTPEGSFVIIAAAEAKTEEDEIEDALKASLGDIAATEVEEPLYKLAERERAFGYNLGVAATIERCAQAVWDAGGDNVEFHCAAIRALKE